MKLLRVSLLPTAALILSACGGAGSSATAPAQLSNGVFAPDPAPVVASFTAMASSASCANLSNRLYVIDNKQVFWARSGNCADNSYGYTLYGATPELPLCSSADSIAGPRSSCNDARYSELFATISKNLDKADLGLGKDHKVEELKFLPPAEAKALPITILETSSMSGVAKRQQVVIKDADAFAALWKEHMGNVSPPQPVPEIDWRANMLVAVFTGQSGDGCKSTAIRAVTNLGDKLSVAYYESTLQTLVACPAVMTSAVQMALVPRSDLPVSFANVTAERVKTTLLASASVSGVSEARTAVVKDAKEFSVIMKQFYGDQPQLPTPVPEVDFNTQMVVAIFLGNKPNGCAGIGEGDAFMQDGKLHVVYHERVQIPGAMCSMQITSPAMLLVLPKSDAPVIVSNDGLPF